MTLSFMVLVFCSINQQQRTDSVCTHYVNECIENRGVYQLKTEAYPRCTIQWVLNQGKTLGTCLDPTDPRNKETTK